MLAASHADFRPASISLNGGMRFFGIGRGARVLGLVLVGGTVVTVAAGLLGLLDPVALLITIGGGVGVTAMTYSRPRLERAWVLVQASLAEPDDVEDVLLTLKRMGRLHRVEGAPAMERAGLQAADPFLRTAVGLAAEGRDAEELESMLLGEARRSAGEGEDARQVVLLLGKLFPAFGLIGTLIGLAHLLRSLGTATSLAAIGPGLGIAVTTTLYGAVLANVVVLPLAAKLHAYIARRQSVMHMVIDGMLMVQRKEYPTRIERTLRSAFALPAAGERRASGITLAERAA